jgi:small subunit ribosomal protein S25
VLSIYREFYFWHIPHIQYKNPNVQIVRFLEMTPNPFIRIWFDDGNDILFDCDSQSKDDILKRLIKVVGKSKERLELEAKLNVSQLSVDNPAIFGWMRSRWCMCEIPGQVPCPGVISLPKNMRGKHAQYLKEDLEKEKKNLILMVPYLIIFNLVHFLFVKFVIFCAYNKYI